MKDKDISDKLESFGKNLREQSNKFLKEEVRKQQSVSKALSSFEPKQKQGVFSVKYAPAFSLVVIVITILMATSKPQIITAPESTNYQLAYTKQDESTRFVAEEGSLSEFQMELDEQWQDLEDSEFSFEMGGETIEYVSLTFNESDFDIEEEIEDEYEI